jgi:hypothetical protein
MHAACCQAVARETGRGQKEGSRREEMERRRTREGRRCVLISRLKATRQQQQQKKKESQDADQVDRVGKGQRRG